MWPISSWLQAALVGYLASFSVWPAEAESEEVKLIKFHAKAELLIGDAFKIIPQVYSLSAPLCFLSLASVSIVKLQTYKHLFSLKLGF